MPRASEESPDPCRGAHPCQHGRSRRPEPRRGLGSWRGPREAKRAGIPAWEKEGSDSSLPVPTGQTLPGRDSYAPRSAQAQRQLPQPRSGRKTREYGLNQAEKGRWSPAPAAAAAPGSSGCRRLGSAQLPTHPCHGSGEGKVSPSAENRDKWPGLGSSRPAEESPCRGCPQWGAARPHGPSPTQSRPLSLPSRVILPMPIPLLQSELVTGFRERTTSRASVSDVQCPLSP